MNNKIMMTNLRKMCSSWLKAFWIDGDSEFSFLIHECKLLWTLYIRRIASKNKTFRKTYFCIVICKKKSNFAGADDDSTTNFRYKNISNVS